MARLCFDLSFFLESRSTEGSESRGEFVYRVAARVGGEQAATERIRLRLQEVVGLEEELDTSDGVDAAEAEQGAIEFGTALFESFFRGSVRDLYFQAYGQAQAETQPLRIRLRFADEVPELAALSWEFLYWPAGRRFWALSVSIVRHLELPDDHRHLRGALPLRLLMVSASPANAAELTLDDHKMALDGPLAELRRCGLIERRILEEADLESLAEMLDRTDIDVLHIVTHGEFDAKIGRGSLIFEDLLRRARPVADRSLAALLKERPPRLAVLMACEGGDASTTSLFDGMAQQLVLQGIPAVIAMRSAVRGCDAIQLTESLYSALARGRSIDQALIRGRAHIQSQHPTAWGIPALFSRSPETHLFELPRHFGHPFARQILAIEAVLDSEPKRAVATVCTTPLEKREMGRDGEELMAIQGRLKRLRARGQYPDCLELSRQLRRFLTLLIKSKNQ